MNICMCRETRQHKIIVLGRNKRSSVRALGKARVESTAQWRKKYKFMCVYKYTCVVPLLFHLVIVLCL